jgi:hypothetical protein
LRHSACRLWQKHCDDKFTTDIVNEAAWQDLSALIFRMTLSAGLFLFLFVIVMILVIVFRQQAIT